MKRKFQKWCTPNGKNVVQYEIGHKDGKQWHGKSKHMDEVVFINESQNMELIMKEIQFNKDSFDHTNAIVGVNEN